MLSKFLKKMIVPSIMMIWALTYYLQVIKLPARNTLLIVPVFWGMVVLYVINGVMDYIDVSREAKEERQEKSEGTEHRAEKQKINIAALCRTEAARVIYAFAALILYVLVVEKLGFLISTYLLLIGVFQILEIRGKLRTFLLPAVIVAVSYILFKILLNVPLPAGLLF